MFSAAPAEELTVAAASDLSFVMPELAARFEKQTGHTVKFTFGSSGNLYSQIENGAPFDVFFSADLEYPRRLDAAGKAAPGTLTHYADGRLALWVLKDSRLDLSRGLAALLDPAVRKVAIANPRHAPYGRAAVAALQHEDLYDRVQSKLVLGENISQTAQFVESGSADAGLIALSLASSQPMREKGRFVELPASLHPPIEQGCVALKSSTHEKAARAFLDFLKKPESRELLRSQGFVLPEASMRDKP